MLRLYLARPVAHFWQHVIFIFAPTEYSSRVTVTLFGSLYKFTGKICIANRCFLVAHKETATLFEFVSTKDHIGVKLAVADNNPCEHLLEFFNFDLRFSVSNCSVLVFFEGFFQFSIEPPVRSIVNEELKQTLGLETKICSNANLHNRYFTADSDSY